MRKILMSMLGSLLVATGVLAQEKKVNGGIIGGVSMDWYEQKENISALNALRGNVACSFHIGYQTQFYFRHRFSVDAALLYGQRRGKFFSHYGHTPGSDPDEKFAKNYLALGGVVNYRLFNRWKAGVGVEPTYYFKETVLYANTMKATFDIPLVVKLAYSFPGFDVSLAYKNGFCNVMKGIPSMEKSQVRDLQLSVYVPIFRK